MRFTLKNKRIILFDFDRASIRYLVLEKVMKRISIVEEIEIPQIKNISEGLSHIKRIAQKPQECALTLPNSKVMIKTLPINIKLQNKDLKKFVILNVEKEFQCSITDVIYDYEFLKNSQQLHLRLITAKKSLIYDYTSLLRSHHCHLNIIDVESLVIERLLRFLTHRSNYSVVFLFRAMRIVQLFIVNGVTHRIQEITSTEQESLEETFALMLRFYRLCSEYQTHQIITVALYGGSDFINQTICDYFRANDINCEFVNFQQLTQHCNLVSNNQLSLKPGYAICYGLLLRYLGND